MQQKKDFVHHANIYAKNVWVLFQMPSADVHCNTAPHERRQDLQARQPTHSRTPTTWWASRQGDYHRSRSL